MKIKSSHTPHEGDTAIALLKRRKLLAVIFIIAVVAAVSFAYGYKYHREGYSFKDLPNILQKPVETFTNYMWGFTVKPENIYIDIKHKDFQKLSYKRQLALEEGLLLSSPDDYVPAKIRYKDKTIKAKIRLKGDFTTHLLGDKWSFRVKVKGDDALFGMKRFSIHHPRERKYIYEWLYHKMLRGQDVLSLRYEFINVTMNGKNLGVYALEEHFGKRLLEYNQRREGPIIRFSENLYWKGNMFPGSLSDTENYMSAEIDGFQTNRTMKAPVLLSQFEKASALLENFRSGRLKTSEAFDSVTLSKYLAVTELFGASHAFRWHNSRYYYNPLIGKLEPMGFDADAGVNIKSLIYYQAQRDYMKHPWTVFADMELLKRYIKELDRISRPDFLDSFFNDLDEELNRNLKIIYGEFPYFIFDKDTLYQNQKFIRSVLNPEKGLHAYFKNKDDDGIVLQLGNIQTMPIEVLSISLADSTALQPVDSPVLPSKFPIDIVKYYPYVFSVSENVTWSAKMLPGMKLNYRVLGTEKVRQVEVRQWNFLDDRLIEDDFIRQPANAQDFDFLRIDEEAKTIAFTRDKVKLSENLIVPAGYTLNAYAGLKLDLVDSAKILSFSPIKFIGADENPILVHSSDSTGQGIVIMRADRESLLEHTVFDNLSNPAHGVWSLTGAVTFYKSSVKIYNCILSRSRSEDALNIIRSDFLIEDTLFSRSGSDALDADFSEGEINTTRFIESGNDAVDISGSYVVLQSVTIDKAGDKGLSAGEMSRLRALGTRISNAEIAVASKDDSVVNLISVHIDNSKIGFAAYQKKPEFGPSKILVREKVLKNIEIPFLVESGSSVIADGKTIVSDKKNVKEILYGVEYGKSSK